MRHTIVIELPDGTDPNEVERTITCALEARSYVTAVNNEGSDYGRLKVVEYHQEQVTEPSEQWCPACKDYHSGPIGERTDAGIYTKACPRVPTTDPRYYDGTNFIYTGDRGAPPEGGGA
jgi:hypothetical protein